MRTLYLTLSPSSLPARLSLSLSLPFSPFSQLEDVLQSLGMKPTEHQLEQIVNELDQNRDGTVELSEFLRVMAVPKRGSAAFKLMSRVQTYTCVILRSYVSEYTYRHLYVLIRVYL